MKNNRIVAKFGGTSCATADQLRKVRDIISSDPRRRVIVVSAPGKAHQNDKKVTDLLLRCHQLARGGDSIEELWTQIADKFRGICTVLNLTLNIEEILTDTRHQIERIAATGGSPDYAASRGEAINGLIVAEMLSATYVDAADVIHFDQNGQVTSESYRLISQRCAGDGLFVIPGFYGMSFDGNIKTFSRGGSDITGAIVANALGASVYENWTDVPGVLMTDPRIVAGARSIREITYKELREMAYAGASVLHADAVYPAQICGIPINIRDTNNPDHPGTRITSKRDSTNTVIGIAGDDGFISLNISIPSMLSQVGIIQKALRFFAERGIPIDHVPTGIDNFSIVLAHKHMPELHTEASLNELCGSLESALNCGEISVRRLALVVLVGDGSMYQPWTQARMFTALGHAEVITEMVAQSTAMSIVLGINRDQYEIAVRTLYDEFVKETNA